MKTTLGMVCLITFLAIATEVNSATWYTSPTGSGTTCSEASPCTLTYTINTKSASGDTIIVTPGSYSGGFTLNKTNVTITSTPAVISALGTFNRGIPGGTDSRPVITGTFTISASGVTISYLAIKIKSGSRSDDMTTGIQVNGENAIIDHCHIYNGGQGIRISRGRLVTIEYCLIDQLGPRGTDFDTHGIATCRTSTNATSWSEAITVRHNTIHDTGGDSFQDQSACTDYGCSGPLNYVIIDDNEFYDNDEQCIDVKGGNYIRISNNDFHDTDSVLIISTTPTDDCPGAKSGGDYWEIYNNRLHDNDDGAIATVSGGNISCSNWKVYNNLIYHTARSPGYNSCAVVIACSGTNAIYENTFYQNKRTSGSTNVGGLAACTNGSQVRNNLFYDNGAQYGNIASSFHECSSSGTPSYNYVYPSSPGQAGTNAITSSNPGMNNPASGDFTLTSTSVCKDAGTTLASPYDVDYAGISRPQDSAWDMGAYEHRSGGSDIPPAPRNLNVIQNP
jgi:hypothetical protein